MGFLIPIIPTSIYLIAKNSLIECLNISYFGIMSGFETGDLLYKISIIKKMLLDISQTGAIILILGIIIGGTLLIITKKITEKPYKKYIIGVILAIIINTYANMIAGSDQLHYMITFIPIMCMCIALAIKAYEQIKLNPKVKSILLAIIILSVSLMRIYKISKSI